METNKQYKEYWLSLLIDRLTGSISGQADLSLQKWENDSEANKQYAERIEQLWETLDIVGQEEEFDSERAFLLFKERVSQEPKNSTKQKKRINRFPLRKVLSYAAVLIPFLLLSYSTYSYFLLKSGHEQDVSLSEVVVPNGSKTQLTLQDGSKVWLNAGSKIQYDSRFGEKSRTLRLSGEAYLEVAPNANCPFLIFAGDVKVKVLGTRFNVNAYEENKEVKVALLQGAIEMQVGSSTPLQMTSKDIASFDRHTKKISIYKNSLYSGYAIDWINNRFVFNSESFEQIAHTLERSFNVQINIRKESIKKRQFVGDFVNNETIEQIFRVMSADGKFAYTINGNTIDVY